MCNNEMFVKLSFPQSDSEVPSPSKKAKVSLLLIDTGNIIDMLERFVVS